MNSMLRLCEDVLSDHGAMELPALPRMIFVVHGAVAIADGSYATRRRSAAKARSCSKRAAPAPPFGAGN
jgi:hypothetical protein